MKEIPLRELHHIKDDENTAFTNLGIEKAVIGDSFSVVMPVKDIHLNTHNTVHGGILFALCEEALSSYMAYKERQGVGMDGNIHFYRPAFSGDTLTATICERKSGKKVGVYFVELKNQAGKLIADCVFSAMYTD